MLVEGEHVVEHVEIDACDIFISIYNLLPHPSSLFERMVGPFF
jgi:hypothetical protein